VDEDFLKEVASQLRKPNGEFGNEVADKMNISNREMNLKTIESLNIQTGETILEVGMANGAFVSQLLDHQKNVDYVGVDHSNEMVELAKRNNEFAVNKGYAKFLKGNISNLPCATNSVDKMFTVNTIYFWENIYATIQECSRVLKMSGVLAISIRPEGCLRLYPSTQFNFKYFKKSDIEKILIEGGFEIILSIQNSEAETEILDQQITPEYAIIVGKKVI